MSIRKKILILFFVSTIGLITGLYLPKFYNCGVSIFCLNVNLKSLALINGMSALSSVFLFLLIRPSGYEAWIKFAPFFVFFATIIFFQNLEVQGQGFMQIGPSPEQIFRWVSWLYVILSFVIIFRNRKIS